MESPNKGFAQHYGFWAIFVTTPIILFLTRRLLDKFLGSMRKLDDYCVNLTSEMRSQRDKLIHRHVESLSLHSRSVWIFVFVLFVFLCWWLLNIRTTISPFNTYRHDVFDAYSHFFGFYTAKIYGLLLFTLVYSVAVFVALHVTVSMISILKFLHRHDVLRINLFHEDNCGGTSRFGNINLIILAIYANFFTVMYMMYLTHRQTYLAIVVSLIACSFLAMAQSLSAVYYIHKTVAKKKREFMEAMTLKLNKRFTSSLKDDSPFPSDLLAFRNHVVDIHTFPYASGALVAVNFIRFAPVALGVISYFVK